MDELKPIRLYCDGKSLKKDLIDCRRYFQRLYTDLSVYILPSVISNPP